MNTKPLVVPALISIVSAPVVTLDSQSVKGSNCDMRVADECRPPDDHNDIPDYPEPPQLRKTLTYTATAAAMQVFEVPSQYV